MPSPLFFNVHIDIPTLFIAIRNQRRFCHGEVGKFIFLKYNTNHEGVIYIKQINLSLKSNRGQDFSLFHNVLCYSTYSASS